MVKAGTFQSVWDALDSLGVERVDHGVRSIDDPALVERIARTQVPLTVCPVSNVALKVYPTLAAHPIKRLMDQGVLVTLNSDDPPMFHTDVLDNYFQVTDTFNLALSQVEALARDSFRASFMDDTTKTAYLGRFDEEARRLRAELAG